MKICLLQETRADAGIYIPLIQAMDKDERFALDIISSWASRPNLFPEWLIVLGDRRAMLEATIDAAYHNIPIAHIHGGDRTGTIDDPCRHAITRFAHLHFPATQDAADRLIRMGEEPWRIKIVGPLGIYSMPRTYPSKAEVCEKLGLDLAREIVLVIQHPVTTQRDQAGEQMRQTIEAVKGWQTVVIYPNSDPGSTDMVKEIESCDWIKAIRNLPYLNFIDLLSVSSVIVGNSSCGLYEAPLFGVPCVDIGTRQQNRLHGDNVRVALHRVGSINWEIKMALLRPRDFFNPFTANQVDGVKVIMDTIAGTPIDELLLQKMITY